MLQPNNALVDDTAFGGSPGDKLLVADKPTNTIYAVTGPFNPNFGYSAATNAMGLNGFIGAFDASTFSGGGNLTPIVTGLGDPGGEAFLATVPEPSTWAMMLIGFGGLGYAFHRSRRQGIFRLTYGWLWRFAAVSGGPTICVLGSVQRLLV